MGVFVSWAIEGSLSHRMALCIKEWLPNVFVGQVECFVSSTDISAGSVWLQELFGQLERSQSGIVCVTRESMSRGWMLFEAGALAKMIGSQSQRVCPILLDLDPGELQYPLAAFQWKLMKPESEESSKAQVHSIVKMVNESLEGSFQLAEIRLAAQFEAFWPQLWKAYLDLRSSYNGSGNHAPVLIGNDQILVELRAGFRQMLVMLEKEQRIDVRVQCPRCGAEDVGEFHAAIGATRHFTCSKCNERFIAHLDAAHQARTKLAVDSPLPSRGEDGVLAKTESIAIECPACGHRQSETFSTVPGSTCHPVCDQCGEKFVAHRLPDGSSRASTIPRIQPVFSPIEAFLRKTQYWLDAAKVSSLLHDACDADKAMTEASSPKSPSSLKREILTRRPGEASGTVNIFIKLALHGGAFHLSGDEGQAAFYRSFSNRLERENLLQSIYQAQTKRLRTQFPDLGMQNIEELRAIFQTSIIEGGDAALALALTNTPLADASNPPSPGDPEPEKPQESS